jgi:hypothetical protein
MPVIRRALLTCAVSWLARWSQQKAAAELIRGGQVLPTVLLF